MKNWQEVLAYLLLALGMLVVYQHTIVEKHQTETINQ